VKTRLSILNYATALVFLPLIFTMEGCIGDVVSIPKKVDGMPNTFRATVRTVGERVLGVTVYDYASEEPAVAWHIDAVADISARGFRVSAGIVPPGFTQTIPSPPTKFQPVSGREYGILIRTNARSIHTGPANWVAE